MGNLQKRLNRTVLLKGVQDLTQKDVDLARIASLYGPPPLWEREEGFHTLIHIILEQQVSLASAKAAYKKLANAVARISPKSFIKLSDGHLKRIGFSRQKTRYGRELAHAVTGGVLNLAELGKLSDQEARKQLVQVTGIGSWTADIYLVMALGRPDVWPDGDLALAAAIRQVKGLSQRPSTRQMRRISRQWRPWRAVAARLLWHFYLREKRPLSVNTPPATTIFSFFS